MLVLALEFSRGTPARDAHRSATEQPRIDGRVRGERPPSVKLRGGVAGERTRCGHSLKTEERKPGAATPRSGDGRALHP
jgi:hypothetical protein